MNAKELEAAILLATFNGAKWLDEQLESIVNQSHPNWKLYISDDASTDGTPELLKRWRSRFPDKITLFFQPRNLGHQRNFEFLLSRPKEPYLFFCDQDDIWATDKLSRQLELLRDQENRQSSSQPLGVFSDLTLISEDGRLLHRSFWKYQKIGPEMVKSLSTMMICNVVTGCTMGINRAAANLCLGKTIDLTHDHWTALQILKSGGSLVWLDAPLVAYRQHESNSVGARSFYGQLTRRIALLFAPHNRRLARLAVEEGLYRGQGEYYFRKLILWVKRAFTRY